jgi:alanyl-tRNA synthetase
MLTAAQIRRKYLDFFVQHGHAEVAGASLIPANDPTLLFTSAGMVQFKALYSGAAALPYSRATTCQKCLRAGGKGSDLENVGKTLRHFTFFEMLGNFSFGDYFKRDAIAWAWELCTGKDWLALPAERLWPTIFGKPGADGKWTIDEEARDIWLAQPGLVNPLTPLDEKENFWGPAGETGACGPCSEIKFFMGSAEDLAAYQKLARSEDPAGRAQVADDIVEKGDLFLEIWNLVFPQFDQQPDGSRPPLKNRGIDTGLGLERTTTAVQFMASGGKINTPYESDLLRPLVDAVAGVAGLPYPALSGGAAVEAALRERGLDPAAVRLAINACTDHARTVTFALAEGIVPSNEGRGYVIRRILRRAARFGKKLGIVEPFLWRLVDPIVKIMGPAYPEIAANPDYIKKVIRSEEERFTRTLNQGSEVLDGLLSALAPGQALGKVLSGEDAYRLYDTFGFPVDLTQEAAEERGVAVDMDGFNAAMAEAKKRARASWKGGAGTGVWVDLMKGLTEDQKTKFTGYGELATEATILALVHDGKRVDRLAEGQAGVVVLDATPFYAESGGQIGDRGELMDVGAEAGEDGAALFNVEDAQKTAAGYVLHYGEAAATLEIGQKILARVDAERRAATVRNHSSVHLLQGALKRLVGQHVTQQGSWVGPDGMRFDFTNPEPVGEDRLREVERLVNEQIVANLPVVTREMSLKDARASGAVAPFEEKYGSTVRVVSMGEADALFSMEFCGGTHAVRTGDLGQFVIVAESSVASGIRRIEGRAGLPAYEARRREHDVLARVARRVSVTPDGLEERLTAMQDEIKALRRQADEARADAARRQVAEAAKSGVQIAGVRFVHQAIDGAGHDALAGAWDSLKDQLGGAGAVGLFYSVEDGKVNMIVGVTDDLAGKKIKAGDVLKAAAEAVGGKGGGRPNLARGGGSRPENIDQAVAAVVAFLEKALA